MKKHVFGFTLAVFSAFYVYGWGRGHDDVAKLCAEYMPAEQRAFLGAWNDKLDLWCHFPDMTSPGWGARRFMKEEDLRREIGDDAETFVKWGFRHGDWLHRHTGRAVTFAVLRKAFAAGNPKLAAFCISVLSHSVSDQTALNHPPILQFATYSKFKGIDYGWKNSPEFSLGDAAVARLIRKRLAAYRPKLLGKSFDEAAYEMVMDCYRQSEVAAETETMVAFGTKDEYTAAMARVVVVQMEAMLDLIRTAWELKDEGFEITKEFLDGIAPHEEVRRRRGDPRVQAVYKGLFKPVLNPANPKATVGIVCEPYGTFHVRALSYVGKILVAAAGRTLRDNGYAVRGISFWDIEKDALPSPDEVQVILIAPGGRPGMSERQIEALKRYRAAGGRLFVMGGCDQADFTGLGGLLERRTDSEVPVSSKWGFDGVGDWASMRVILTPAMTRSGAGPFKLVRNPNFDGFCKPCCMWSLKDDPLVKPLARLQSGEKTFTVGGLARGVCWMPEYLFLPFLFSNDTVIDWQEMRLDSFSSNVLLDAMAALLDARAHARGI